MSMQLWKLSKADWKKIKAESKVAISEDVLTEDIDETLKTSPEPSLL